MIDRADVNECRFTGLVTQGPFSKLSPGGVETTRFVIECTSEQRGRSAVSFITCHAYGELARTCAGLVVGAAVRVLSRCRSWHQAEERKSGYRFEVVEIQEMPLPKASAGA